MIIDDPNQAPRGAQSAAPAVGGTPEIPHTRRERISRSERFALYITNVVGTLRFFFVICAWTLGWLAWNALGPKAMRFDPYPAFVLWLFLSNVIQLFLMPLIMVGQNLQARAADKRGEADLAINRSAEEQVSQLHRELVEIKRLLEDRSSALRT